MCSITGRRTSAGHRMATTSNRTGWSELMTAQEMPARAGHTPLLVQVNRFGRMPGDVRLTRLDFHKHDHAAVHGDQVQLTEPLTGLAGTIV